MPVSVHQYIGATVAGFLGLSLALTTGSAIAQSTASPESDNGIRVESQAGSFQRRSSQPTEDTQSADNPQSLGDEELTDNQNASSEDSELSQYGWEEETVPAEADDIDTAIAAEEDSDRETVTGSGNAGAIANTSPVFDLNIGTELDGPGGGSGGSNSDGGNGSGDGSSTSGDGSSGSDRQSGAESGSGSDRGVGNNAGSGSGIGRGTGDGEGDGEGSGGEGAGRYVEYIPEVTGLIVDARQLDFVPSMSMRLYDPEGNQIYTTLTANRDLNTHRVASNGTALFVTNEADARSLVNRIGERPATVVAQSTLGYDLVLSNGDAWNLRQQNVNDRFLDNFSVVVIWTP